MKQSWLSLTSTLALLALLTSCQEKVAPELTDAGISGGATGGAAGGGGGGATASSSFWLNLGVTATDKTPAQLKYQLHKANELVSSQCRVDDVVDTPGTLSSLRDITCFIEAEEAILYNNGLGLEINADAGACEYVAYQPYSFLKWQPGRSVGQSGGSRPMNIIKCSAEFLASQSANIASASFIGAGNPDSLTYAQVCGRVWEVNGFGNITAASAQVMIPKNLNLSNFCSFDYSLNTPADQEPGPNCDSGSLNVTNVDLTIANSVPTAALEAEDFECNGNPRACTEGPLLEAVPSYLKKGDIAIIVDTMNASYQENYQVTAPEDKGLGTNLYVANFTRQCSGVSAWSDLNLGAFVSSANSYNYEIISEYSQLGVDTSVGPTTDSRGFTIRRLADDPFRGDPVVETSPHYTFLCLDGAYEIRARIKLAVREWNKQFNPATTSFAFVSDVFNDLGAPFTAVMDATQSQVVPWGILRPENDVTDWDDLLKFDDTAGPSCSTSFMNDGVNAPGSRFWFPERSL